MADWQDYLEQNAERYREELFEFLRIPSISALPEHAGDVQRAAEWTADRLKRAGIENVAIHPTGGHPVVYADWLHAEGRPTVLIYGHFDVQPVDPVDLWSHPPFEPTVEDDRVYARGATDDKGNMLAPIQAIEALLETEGQLPVNVKCFFEGQEEIGSPQLPDFVAAHGDLLAADLVLSADGGQWSETEPSLSVGLRGICALQIDLRGPSRDLHSGSYGGAVQNPIHAMVQLLDSMRAPDGRILVEGFYDDVRPLTDKEREQIARVPFDEAEYRDELDVDALWGEADYTPRERTWARPTLEINGIWGGFQGQGSKTVLPSDAHAKISCRLVPDQSPQEIVKRIQAHVEQHCPPGVRAEAYSLGAGADPYLIPADHPGNQAASRVLESIYGREPYFTRMGGTIPVCALFLQNLNAYTVIFGFGLPDERTHAPDEFWRLSSFRRSRQAYVQLFGELAETEL